MEDKTWIEKVHKDEFLVAIDMSDEVQVVLPSLWNDFVRPGMTVLIMFSYDQTKANPWEPNPPKTQDEPRLYGRPEVHIVNADVDVAGTSDMSSRNGSPPRTSLPVVIDDAQDSDLYGSVAGSDDQNSEAPTEDGDASSEAPSAKPVSAYPSMLAHVSSKADPRCYSAIR